MSIKGILWLCVLFELISKSKPANQSNSQPAPAAAETSRRNVHRKCRQFFSFCFASFRLCVSCQIQGKNYIWKLYLVVAKESAACLVPLRAKRETNRMHVAVNMCASSKTHHHHRSHHCRRLYPCSSYLSLSVAGDRRGVRIRVADLSWSSRQCLRANLCGHRQQRWRRRRRHSERREKSQAKKEIWKEKNDERKKETGGTWKANSRKKSKANRTVVRENKRV